MQLVKKISAKNILGNVVEVVKGMEIGDKILAFSVAGVANGIKTGVSTYGEWVAFTGTFQATNYLNEDVYRGSVVHPPEVLVDILREGLTAHDTIEFAYEVSLERLEDDEKGAISYKYHTSPKTEVKESDELAHLTALLAPPNGGGEAPKPKAAPKKAPVKKASA